MAFFGVFRDYFSRFLVLVFILAACAGVDCALAGDAAAAKTKATRTAERRKPKVRDFSEKDSLRNLWRDQEGTITSIVDAPDEAHGLCGSVNVAFPESSEVWLDKPVVLYSEKPADGQGTLILSRISYEVFIPAEASGRIETALLLKDKDGLYFSCAAPAPLVPGQWNEISFDLSGVSPDISPRGHAAGWSLYRLSTIRHIGFAFWADTDFSGTVLLDNITTWPEDPKEDEAPLTVTGLQVPENVKQYGKYEIAFNVNRDILNPFAQEEIKIDAVFTDPAGKNCTVPSFYMQDFVRGKAEPDDTFTPVGRPCFRVRFTPRLPGKYVWHLQVEYKSPVGENTNLEKFTSQQFSFDSEATEAKGFVRISEKDYRFFEYENGEFFYPHGHNFRSPIDLRDWEQVYKRQDKKAPKPIDRGLKIYEEYLPKMAEAGENAIEFWMASWWLGLEWNSKLKGYQGLGRYNLEHAWKLDRLLELCSENGLRVHLVIDNHGKASKNPQFDHEWEFSPYNIRSGGGGFLKTPEQLFSDKKAKAYYKNKFRYIAARWGYSTDIFAFEFWSELDLIGSIKGRKLKETYGKPEIHAWHKEMAAYLNELDQGKHMLTTHYSGNYNVIDKNMIKLPEISYIACDAYRSPKETLVDLLLRSDKFAQGYNKPYLITEFGGDWNAGTWSELEGDLHAGLWLSWHSHAAGSSLFWWFEHINRRNLYGEFRSLANYIAGEDKRRAKDEPQLKRFAAHIVDGKVANKVGSSGISDGRVCYLWMFDRASMKHLPAKDKLPKYNNVAINISNLDNGTWAVEAWDTWQGKVIKSWEAKKDGEKLSLTLPEFRADIALKLKLKSK